MARTVRTSTPGSSSRPHRVTGGCAGTSRFNISVQTIVLLLIALGALAVFVRLFEPRFAFLPAAGERETPRDFGVEYEALSFATGDGVRLQAWALAHPAPRARIVYFHGNGGNLSVWAPILTGIARQGYAVLAFDYRGYGLSTGRPTESGLYRDVDAVIERFWSGSQPTVPVLYWGRSLGVAMAAYAATRRAPDGLILESGFPDVWSLVRSVPPLLLFAPFSTYRFPSAGFLQRVTAPVLVVHGDADRVIPIAQGRALFSRITGPKQFVTIRGGDHNDLAPPDPRAYWEAVRAFIAGLPARTNPG
jgi:fermentation-respiration switch protein FrsA (DUF1100 family)